ncbi:MAG TPA: helix-turn-helix domain-containing protein [Pyrinomonadaceae bacterium]|jgi:hypothetical protein|nr:helix-turn-helix domain-containing protein [Pyrinomonadaceae bacterium]
MNKLEAVEYLKSKGVEISVRTLQRAVSANELPVAYVRGHKGDEASFSESDLDRFAERRSSATYVSRDVPGQNNGTGGTPQALMRQGTGASPALAQLLSLIEQARAQARPQETISDLAHKLVLSLPEAAALSGVPVAHLRSAVHSKKLKTVGVGRGLGKVKRADLDLFVKKL